ncbi:DUF692 domain-containing protein [Streptomyces sp. NBC_00388]|uniref:DUF692 domain-containing protein n=1 Tax=Streptomyces sp. NBC_00388 TaxID=2975735 RepID=UPI002E22E817
MEKLGTGIGWRPEIATAVEELPGIDWVEVVAENLCPGHLPDSLRRLRERGVTVIPHGVSLGIGGAGRPAADRLAALAERALLLESPLVTEHIAFVRAGGPLTASPGLEAGHLLPVPRTWDALHVLCENVRAAQDSLPVPLALENIAALISWPGDQLTEGQFLAELVERTGVRLLIDVANLHTNHVNRGEDPAAALDELPVEAIAYVHVAGGVEKDGVWHDTHAHPVTAPVLDVLAQLRDRVDPPGVLLERDDDFPPAAELAGELSAIRATLAAGGAAAVRASGPVRREALAVRGAASPGRNGPASRETVTAGAPGAARERPAAEAAAPASAEAARQRLAVAETALLSALVAGTPPPEGFDARRLGVQSRALAAKRADVVSHVAPELPVLLGAGYRPAFLAYATSRPLSGGYRRDALDFAEQLLDAGQPADAAARRRLALWWQERAAPRRPTRAARFARAARTRIGRTYG